MNRAFKHPNIYWLAPWFSVFTLRYKKDE